MFFKIGVLKNFKNIHKKTTVLESPLMKLLKRDSSTGEYPVNISTFLITPFFTERFRWLLLMCIDFNKFRQIKLTYKNKIELVSCSQINSKSK